MDLLSSVRKFLSQPRVGTPTFRVPQQTVNNAVNFARQVPQRAVNFAQKNPNFVASRMVSPFQLTPSDLPTLYGQQKIQMPRIDLANRTYAQNPTRNKIAQFAAQIPEQIINAPSDYQRGIGNINKGNVMQGIGQAGIGAFNIGTLGGGSVATGIGKNVIQKAGYPAIRQAIKQGAVAGGGYGSIYGGLSGLASSNDPRVQLKEVVKQTAQGALAGAALGGTIGFAGNRIGAFKAAKLSAEDSPWVPQLRDAQGRFTKGQTPVKPNGMPNAQWKFQIKFNKKYGRNPYEPVFPSTLQEAMKQEVSQRGAGLSVRNVNDDLFPAKTKQLLEEAQGTGTLPKTGQGAGRTSQKVQLNPANLSKFPSTKNIAQKIDEEINGAEAGIPKTSDPARIQEIKNSIAEGMVYLRTGKMGGRKLSQDELRMIAKSVENAQAKIGVQQITEAYGTPHTLQEFSSNELLDQSRGIPIEGLPKDILARWRKAVKTGQAELVNGRFYHKGQAPSVPQAGLYDTKLPGKSVAYHFTDKNSAEIINKQGFKSGADLGVREKRAEIYAFPEQTNPRFTRPYDAGGKIKLDLRNLKLEDRTANKYTDAELAKKIHKIIPEGKDGVVVHYGNGANEVVLTTEAANKSRVAQQPISDASALVQGKSGSRPQVSQVAGYVEQPPKTIPIKGQKTGTQPTVPDTTFSSDGIIPPQSARIKTSANRAQEYAQDSWLRQRNLQNQKGVVVKDGANPYQAEELFHGRLSTRIEDIRSEVGSIDQEVMNLSNNLGLKDKDTYAQVNRYLQARHAPERNAALGDGAAGISTKEAQRIVSEIENSPAGKEILKVADRMGELNKKTLDILLDGGVIDKETHTLLRTKYKNHVPLRRVMDESEDIVDVLSGKGLNVKGSGIQRAKGSDREVEDIFGNIVANVDQAIVRAEKNRVNLNTLAFARNNKNLGLFDEIRPKAIGETFEKDGTRKPILEKITDPQVLHVRENGKSVYLRINDPKLAVVLQNLNKEELPTLLKYVGAFTRTYSGLHTRFNPEFAFSNIVRDLQEMAVFASSQKNVGFRGAAGTVSKLKSSAGAVTDYLRGVDSEGARLYKQMKLDGGTTGGMSLSTKQDVMLDIQKIQQLNRSNPRKAAEKTLEIVDKWNTIFEDSTRLSVYREALERGMSREQAASLAKNATVNFNKKGTGGSLINSLYMFSNASIQGSTKMIRAMKNPKTAAAVLAGVGSAVFATNRWNDSVDPEWRNKVTEWDRTSNLVVVLPSNEGAKYLTIPISWGLKPILVSASSAYDIGTGKENNLVDAAKNIAESAFNSYNPAGGSDLVSTAVPTVLDTPVDIARNVAWHGGMIRPDWMKNKPASEQYFKDTPNSTSGKLAVGAAEGISNATGGLIEISPENILYAYEQYVGGVGRSATRVANTALSLAQGEKPQAKNIPVVNRFYKTKTEEQVSKAVASAKKEEIKRSGGSGVVNNELIYYDANGNEQTFDLQPDTSGTGIGALSNSDWTAKQAAKLHRLEGIDDATKNEIYKKWGFTSEEARYADLASYNTDISAQWIQNKSNNQRELLNNLITGRQKSITGTQFATDAVINYFRDEGLITKQQAAILKKIEDFKDGKPDFGTNKLVAGRAKKAKVPKIKAITSTKTQLKQPKIKKVKLGKKTTNKSKVKDYMAEMNKIASKSLK